MGKNSVYVRVTFVPSLAESAPFRQLSWKPVAILKAGAGSTVSQKTGFCLQLVGLLWPEGNEWLLGSWSWVPGASS